MKKLGGMGEAVAAAMSAGADVAMTGETFEQLLAKGRYRFSATGPVEHRRAEYVALRDRLLDLGYDDAVETKGKADAILVAIAGRFFVEKAEEACDLLAEAEALIAKKDRQLWNDFAAIEVEGKWQDEVRNLVTTQGKNDLLDKYLAGSAYTATWYCGLVSLTNFVAYAAGDTAAQINGTNQWKEGGPTTVPNYSQGTRPAFTFASASAGSKATSSASVFTITSNGTVKGCFACSVSTKDGTTGVLLSAGNFTGGDKVVQNGDTLNVSYTLSV